MKKLLLLLVLPLVSSLYAQEISKRKEVGLTFRSLDYFGITFRTGNNHALWRFNSIVLSGNSEKQSADSVESENSGSGFEFSIGREFRKGITEKLTLRYGADVSFGYSKSRNKTDDKSVVDDDYLSERYTYGPGVNLVIGLNYAISKDFTVGAEMLPSFQYRTGKATTDSYYYPNVERDISAFSYGLYNSVTLSLVYQF
ncbi:MAG TPA: hypothetical protein VGK59_10165 [Ohtaekwangia sp.]